MFVAAGVSDVAIGVREKLRGKIGQTKVRRYWAGKRPDWVQDGDSDDEGEAVADKQKQQQPQQKQQRQDSKEDVPPSSSSVEAKDDPRLKRLAEHRRNREEAVARHREIRQAEIISTAVEDKPEVDETAALISVDGKKIELLVDETDSLRLQPDEDAVDEQRRRNKERMLQKLKEEEMLARAAKQEEGEEDEEEEEEEEEESEYETESEEETLIPMIKPVFVKKSERETIAERERLEAEEQALQEAQQKKLEERKVQSLQLMYEVIKKETVMETNKADEAGAADVDTDDDTNPEDDYEAWKARELARIKRDKEQAEALVKEKEEIEKLRKMSEEERLEWEKKNPKPAAAPKGKQRYLQKYYHKGAFFQSDVNDAVMPGGTDIFKRDYSAPTGEDKLDKSILPKVMQVKEFGRSGRTKWTHLVNEDTTSWNSPWVSNDKIRAQYMSKMAGMNKPIAKPKAPLKRSREED